MENYLMGHQKLIFNQTSDDVLQELSWGFRAFYVLVWTRFDTLSFCCWMGDKINSCHLYGIDGEMCGLADYWSYHDNQEIFSSKTTLWFFIWFFIFCHRVCVTACGWLPVFGCDVCTCYPFPGIRTRGATLTKQTCRGRCVTERPHVKPDPLFAGEAKQAVLTIHSDVIWENLISGCGGGGMLLSLTEVSQPHTARTPCLTTEQGHCQLQYIISLFCYLWEIKGDIRDWGQQCRNQCWKSGEN